MGNETVPEGPSPRETATAAARNTELLIVPDELEADAVVPQCLDNQFVSDTVFRKMMDDGTDFNAADIVSLRQAEFKTELIRSLIYSSQVIIQRAFFKNSHFLTAMIDPGRSENKANFEATASLMRSSAIVPYLFNETSLRDDMIPDTHTEGDRIIGSLLEELGTGFRSVRLSKDEDANRRLTAQMSANFGTRIGRLEFMTTEQRNALAAELFTDRSRLDEEGAWEAFEASLDRLVHSATEQARTLRKQNQQLRREHIYRSNFVVEGDKSVVNGQFLRPDRDHPFVLELKKYVDLVYNTNLPDSLNRYTFTPENLPSRMALQDIPGVNYDPQTINSCMNDAEALESIRRAFMATVQKPMSLPLLRDLSIADVELVRALPEWVDFKTAQTDILRNPARCFDFIDRFQSAFDRFQRALSDWYRQHYLSAKTREKYCNYVSIALSLGGKLFIAGSHLGPFERVLADLTIKQIVESLPKTVKGYAAKLMVSVYDIDARALDKDRCYSIELMRTSTELAREDLLPLLEAIHRRGDDGLPGAVGMFADQGKH